MSDSRFDHVYDPVATPNPAYDDDFEPFPTPASSWDRRELAQSLLDRARARQEAIADAFVDALLEGKIALFRILLELEQAALTAESEAEDARRPGLADILLPMLQRERAAAEDARQAPESAPNHAPAHSRPLPSLVAPAEPEESAPPEPGITDIQATTPQTCRSRTVARNHRRAKACQSTSHHSSWKESPETPPHPHPENTRQLLPARYGTRRSDRSPSIPLTLLSLTAVAAESDPEIRIPMRFQPSGTRRPRRRISRCKTIKQRELHA